MFLNQMIFLRTENAYISNCRRLYCQLSTCRFLYLENLIYIRTSGKHGRQDMLGNCLTTSSTSVSDQYIPESMIWKSLYSSNWAMKTLVLLKQIFFVQTHKLSTQNICSPLPNNIYSKKRQGCLKAAEQVRNTRFLA